MVKLSIIVVSWNAKEYLRKCIESIIQDTEDFKTEILVVDNASSDGSQDLIREEFPEAKLICNDANLGFAKANNIGINQSNGTYICLINSDVEVLEGCFDKMIAYIKQNPEIGILGPQILDTNGNIQRSTMGFQTLWNSFCRALALDTLFPKSKLFGGYLMTFVSHDSIHDVNVINGCFWMVRREALNQVGLLDERFFIYAEDKDWCKRFWDMGWKVTYFPEAKAVHYGGASSSNAPIRFYIEMQSANLQYWEKHHSRPAQIGFILIIWLHQIVRILGQTVLYIIKPSKRIQSSFKIRRSIACIRCFFSLYREKTTHLKEKSNSL